MAEAFVELQSQDAARDLAPAEWLALLLDREARIAALSGSRAGCAMPKLRHGQASIEDVDYRAARRLDKALFQQTGRRPLDCRASQSADHETLRRRQVVAQLRAGAKSLPRWLYGALRPRAAPLCRSRTGARRRPLARLFRTLHQGRPADPR